MTYEYDRKAHGAGTGPVSRRSATCRNRERCEMISIVIAAHNEASVLGSCLDGLLADAAPGDLDVTVVPNGCKDTTSQVAARRGVRVVEIERASKAAALNAGDAVAVGFPRVYLDADIVLTTADVRRIVSVLSLGLHGASTGRILAAVPRRQLEVSGRPWLVRAYFEVNGRLPAFQAGLFGRGVIALSQEGRGRFDSFPDMVADDLFLDSVFADDEKSYVQDVVTIVPTPFRTRDLIRRLVRVRRGNAAMRTAGTERRFEIDVRPSDRIAWWHQVVRHEPRLLPAGAVYVGITLVAAGLARRLPESDTTWQRDESTRPLDPAPGN